MSIEVYGAREYMWLAPYWPGEEARIAARADFAQWFAEHDRALPAGPKWTLHGDRGRILGVGGFCLVEGCRWGAWAYMADLRPREWVVAARVAVRVLQWAKVLLPGQGDGRPVQICAVPAKFDAARRLLTSMGFVDLLTDEDGDLVMRYGEAA
jgi:hypothetical protein